MVYYKGVGVEGWVGVEVWVGGVGWGWGWELVSEWGRGGGG